MTSIPSRLVCHGCGARLAPDEPYPFRCPRASGTDDIDHVVRRVIDFDQLDREAARRAFAHDDPNPFRRYRSLSHAYHVARLHGLSADDYVEVVDQLTLRIAAVDRRPLMMTPFGPGETLGRELGFTAPGAVWIKNETGNVSGSHKARHLMSVVIWLEIVERLGLVPDGAHARRLAIASCGNAALAAAVLARASRRPLDVYVPPDAHPSVIDQLSHLGAEIIPCPREHAGRGDPCFHAFRQAVAGGALPFTVQGSENGLAIEGGETLAFEMVSMLAGAGVELDRIFVQVGGGALASSCVQALETARELGLIAKLPRIHAVQTEGAAPLARAYTRVVDRLRDRLREMAGESSSDRDALGDAPAGGRAAGTDEDPEGGGGRADGADVGAGVDPGALAALSPVVIRDELRVAANHRSLFMWPWEKTPRSIATGILDDETYDWLAVVRGMLISGGWPVVVSETVIRDAHALARRTTGIDVCPTGSAGLAGLMALREAGAVDPGERVAVVFTGVSREH